MTAKRREAIAAPAITESATILINEAVFFTVEGAIGGSAYADDILRRCSLVGCNQTLDLSVLVYCMMAARGPANSRR